MRRIRVAQRSRVVAILGSERGDAVQYLSGINYHWDGRSLHGTPDRYGGSYCLNSDDNCLIFLSSGATVVTARNRLHGALAHLPEVT